MNFDTSLGCAQKLDAEDELSSLKEEFIKPYPKQDTLYFCGNSLGLQPRNSHDFIDQIEKNWAELAVDGHFYGDNPWWDYHDEISDSMSKIVGAFPHEVSIMNTLTANLHFLMVSFYRPTQSRYKIIIEEDAFPSDRFVVESQLQHHGFSSSEGLLTWRKNSDSGLLEIDDLKALLEAEGDSVALLMIGGLNYYTGQVLDFDSLVDIGHKHGAIVGLDLAHAAGNVLMNLHDSNVDFAAWCTYKYMNSGPGALSGIFVHERHGLNPDTPRFSGWWGHKRDIRFKMRDAFVPEPGAEGWMLSNQPMFALAPIKASMVWFDKVGMPALRAKSEKLTAYLEFLLDQIDTERIQILTPRDPQRRGCQLSIQVKGADRGLFEALLSQYIIGDWREPDVIRIAPVPLYNSFEDVFKFVDRLRKLI